MVIVSFIIVIEYCDSTVYELCNICKLEGDSHHNEVFVVDKIQITILKYLNKRILMYIFISSLIEWLFMYCHNKFCIEYIEEYSDELRVEEADFILPILA